MDNQQERLDRDKIWLAGLMEGEGWFSLCRNTQTSDRQKGQLRYSPVSGICNTDFQMLEEIKRILDSNGMQYVLQTDRTNGILCKNPKRKWELSIIGLDRCIKFLSWIYLELRGEKKIRAEKILEFCKIRKEKVKKFHRAPYGEREHEIYKEIYSYVGKSQSKILNDYTPESMLVT